MRRVPNTHSPEEVRRAFQHVQFDTAVLSEGLLGQVLVGAGLGTPPTWTTSLTALTLLTVDSITINGAAITSNTGAISFDNENISTTGSVSGVNVTSGENPGHTHTGSSLSGIDISEDTNLAATSPIVLTGDTLSLNQGSVDHGSIGGLGDDDHTQYLLANGTRAISAAIAGVDITLSEMVLGTPTYASVADWFNTIQASGRISGMTLSAHAPANGTLDISAGTGIIKTTNAVGATTKFFNYSGGNVALTDGHLNYVYLDYDGGNLTVKATTDRTAIRDYDQFTIGRCFRVGTDTSDITTSGTNVYNSHRRIHNMLVKKYGFAYASGSTLSESGVRKLDVTAGVWYIGATEIATAAHNSNTGGYAFDTFYYTGSEWVQTAGATQLGNTQYNDVTSGLVSLGSNKYMNYWIYLCPAGDLYALYGQAQYATLAAAQATQTPTTLPTYISENTRLIARLTIKQGDTNFSAVSNALITALPSGTVADHGNLAGLADDDHPQYHTDARAATWLAAGHETTYNHSHYNTAYGWGNHASAGYITGESDTLATVTGRGASTTNGITVGNVTDSALTSGRVVLASTSGLLTDDADLTFNGTTLSTRLLKFAYNANNFLYFYDLYVMGAGYSYANPGGSGDRTASVTVTNTIEIFFNLGTITQLINGVTNDTNCWFNGSATSGKYIRFDFGSSRVIQEAKWWQTGGAYSHGDWRWQGSDDASSWTNIGSSFTLGGINGAQTITTLSENVTAYRYYQLLGVSGSTSSGPYLCEVEFKIDGIAVWYPGTQAYQTNGSTVAHWAIQTVGGNFGVGQVDPTARLHLAAGTTAASSAPLKFTSGSLTTVAEAGAVEFLTDDYYATITTAAARQKFALTAGLTSGRVSYATTNGRLTDSANLTFDGNILTSKALLSAGSTTAGTAPLKFTSGSLLTSPEVGAIEFLTDKWYATITTGTARKEIALTEGLTSGRVPYVTTNGRLTDASGFTFDGTVLQVGARTATTLIATNTTYYIATTGNDTTGDGSSGSPWATIAKALSYLSDKFISPANTVTILLADGTYTVSSTISITHPSGGQITIAGTNTYDKTINSVVSSSGGTGNWSYVLAMDSVTNIAVNDYIMVRAMTGGTYPLLLCGCHKVTNVDTGNVRITVTAVPKTALAASGNCTGTATVLKTILDATTASRCFSLANGIAIASVQKMAIKAAEAIYLVNRSSIGAIGPYVGINNSSTGITALNNSSAQYYKIAISGGSTGIGNYASSAVFCGDVSSPGVFTGATVGVHSSSMSYFGSGYNDKFIANTFGFRAANTRVDLVISTFAYNNCGISGYEGGWVYCSSSTFTTNSTDVAPAANTLSAEAVYIKVV